ncbi:unnamed protein product [Linum trigynum]|uniref:Uncharacterized protein n=1 Tax=Linum trigynum TaxID=586398 RepID=A0AAV2EXJ3_9ROSI
MAFSLCFSFPPNHHHHHHHPRKSLKAAAVAATRVVMNIGQVTGNGRGDGWSFLGGSKVATTCQPKPTCLHHNTSSSRLLYASSSFSASASNVFSVGTTAVLPILRAHASGSKITTHKEVHGKYDTRHGAGAFVWISGLLFLDA